MKNIYIAMLSTTIALLVNACSGEGQSGFDMGKEKIVISNCETYTTAFTDDLIVQNDDNTTIKIIHDANGTKQVCVLSGNAYIVREEN